jgi:hypothetical protein
MGVVQAVHVHANDSAAASHECTICFVAHSAAITPAVFHPDPVFIRANFVVAVTAIFRSVEFASSLYIRPPLA